MLTDEQIERLTDIVEDASWCSDNDCYCHKAASLARDILNGQENYEALED